MRYKDELSKSMNMLAQCGYLFIGQSVLYPGNSIYGTMNDVPEEQRLELPVMEDCQMGMSIGLSLAGQKVCSIFPRMDFLIIAMNQLVNHLDKIKDLSQGIYDPKVIIRTMVGAKKPLDAGLQHTGDYTNLLRAGLRNIDVVKLDSVSSVYPCYVEAMERERSTILIEMGELY